MSETVLINGKAIDRHDKHINVYDRGFLLGYGIFETMRAVNGELVDFPEHWQRLCQGLEKINVPQPMSMAEGKAQCLHCLELNHLDTAPLSGIRLTVTYGEGPRGLAPVANPTPTVAIMAFPVAKKQLPPVKLIISDYVKNQLSPLNNVKTLNYLENSLAKQQALAAGADEAIILNTVGRVAECTTSNIFVVKNGELFTPAIAEGALAGITRQTILDQAKRENIAAHETALTVDALMEADEVFITNSVTPVRPVAQIGQQQIHAADVSTITKQLQSAH